jgi:hypothetical protein
MPDNANTLGHAAIGDKVLIRTVTLYHLGQIEAITNGFVTLAGASWVADTGRFGEALQTGKLSESEYMGATSVAIPAIVDITTWTHELPTSSK